MQQLDHPYLVALKVVATAAGDVALYCDRTEHAEPAQSEVIVEAATMLREGLVGFANATEIDLLALYANRIRAVELRNPAHATSSFNGGEKAREADTWRGLQEVQEVHDREYHLDIVGMSRLDQVRHCALHLGKLCGWYARAIDDLSAREELIEQRVPDTLIFSLKLSTLARVRLAIQRLPRHDAAPGRSPIEVRLAKTSGC